MTLKGLINNSNYRTLIMRLLNKTVSTFSDANYVITALNKAINTSYIPTGDDIKEVVHNFTKIQLARTFNPSCFSAAHLTLTFNEKFFLISYLSTSLTSVDISYRFNNNMEVDSIEINVSIPDDRSQPGRTHYESLTREFYRNNFIAVDWTAKSVELVVPIDLVSLNDHWSVTDNIPNWVVEEISNYNAVWNGYAELLELGYVPVNNLIGFKLVFHNPNNSIQYVVVIEKLHEIDNNYYLLKDVSSCHRNEGVSYLRLIELIKSSVDKQSRRSKVRSKVDEVIEDYEYENEIEVDYDE
jgi:hypothetical protein